MKTQQEADARTALELALPKGGDVVELLAIIRGSVPAGTRVVEIPVHDGGWSDDRIRGAVMEGQRVTWKPSRWITHHGLWTWERHSHVLDPDVVWRLTLNDGVHDGAAQ